MKVTRTAQYTVILQDNQTEADVWIDQRLQVRLVLMNRTQPDNREFNLALPGIGGNYNLNYKWIGKFPTHSKHVKQDIAEAIQNRFYCEPTYLVKALITARRMILEANQVYFNV